MIDLAPGVLGKQIDAAFQQIGIASDLEINGLNPRTQISKGCSLEAWPRSFKAITKFDSGEGEKTDSAPNCLIVIIVRVAVEIQSARIARIECIKGRTVGDVESVIRACRADGKSSANLRAYRYIWQDTMVNTNWSVGQFVDPLRLEPFDENITWTEEFSGAQGYVIIEEIRDLGIHEVHIGAATAGLDLEPAVEQNFRRQFPEKDRIKGSRKCGHFSVALLVHSFSPAGEEEFGGPEQRCLQFCDRRNDARCNFL